MKKLEVPEDMCKNFIPEAMTKEPKQNLDLFKQKNQRDRAYTYNYNTSYNNSKLMFLNQTIQKTIMQQMNMINLDDYISII